MPDPPVDLPEVAARLRDVEAELERLKLKHLATSDPKEPPGIVPGPTGPDPT